MMKNLLLLFPALFFCFVVQAQAQEPDQKLSDKELIQQTIQSAYVEGLQNESYPGNRRIHVFRIIVVQVILLI